MPSSVLAIKMSSPPLGLFYRGRAKFMRIGARSALKWLLALRPSQLNSIIKWHCLRWEIYLRLVSGPLRLSAPERARGRPSGGDDDE